MKRLIASLLLVSIALVAIAFLAEETASFSPLYDGSPASSIESALDVHYFYGSGCSHCANVEPFLAAMEQQYPIAVHKYDLYANRSCLGLFDEYSSRHGLSPTQRGVPAVFVSDACLVGDTSILTGLEDAVKEALQTASPRGSILVVEGANVGGQAARTEVPRLSLLTVTVAALIDAVSPCSIAILVFLIGARAVTARHQQRAVKVGLAFCVAFFLAYMVSGLGLFTIIQISGLSNGFSVVVGVVAVVIGGFYLKDVFWYGYGGFVMEVPRSLKPGLMKMLTAVTSPWGAFIMGFVVCLVELPCTGGPYLFILGQLANDATRLHALPLLLYYNLLFVLPLVTICLLLYSGRISLAKARGWTEQHKRVLRAGSGLTLMALGVYTLPITSVLQLILPVMSSLKVVSGYLLAAALGFTAYVLLKRKPVHFKVGFLLLILAIPTVMGLDAVASAPAPSSISLSSTVESRRTAQCAIQSSLKGEPVMASPRDPLVLSSSDVTFIGGTLDIEYRIGGGDIRVVVLSVLNGPSGLVGDVFTITWVTGLAPDLQPDYYIEPGIKVGNTVEVFADYDGAYVRLTEDYHYIRKRSAGCSIDIEFDGGASCFEPGDPIRIRLEFRSDGVLTDPSDFDVILHNPGGDSSITGLFTRQSTGVYVGSGVAGSPGLRTVEVAAAIEGCDVEQAESFDVADSCEAMDGEFVCGYLPTVQSFSFILLEGCDGTDYLVVWETHPTLYSELSNYLGKYVRLTGVVFDGASPSGDYLLGGWESLKVIVSCADCVASCALAIGFDSGETCFEPGALIAMRIYFIYDGVLTDPTHYQAILEKPGPDSDITNQFHRVAKGVYEATGTAGDPGTRTLSVTATIEGCSATKKESYEVRDQCTETNCSDGLDDDGDGLIDCVDPDCGADPTCSCAIEVILDSGETCFTPNTVDITLQFRDGYGDLTDPTVKTIRLEHIGAEESDVTDEFTPVAEGVYTLSRTVSSPGAYRLNVTATIGLCLTEKVVGFLVKEDCALSSPCFNVTYAIQWDGYGDIEAACTPYTPSYDLHQVGLSCDMDYYYFLWEIDGAVGQPLDSNFNFWAWIDADDNELTGGTLGSEYAVFFSMYYGAVDSTWTGLFDAATPSWPPPKLRDLPAMDYCITGSYLEARIPIAFLAGGRDMKVWMGVDVNFYVLPICMDDVDPLYFPAICSCPDGDGDHYRDAACGGPDCDDDNPAIHPGIPEACDNIDNDCDGVVDGNTRKCFVELDPSLDGVGVCTAGTQICTAGQWGSGCTGEVTPRDEEACWNGLDDDCNAEVDEGCVKTPPCFPDTVGRVKSSTAMSPANAVLPAMGTPHFLMFVTVAMVLSFGWRKEQRRADEGE